MNERERAWLALRRVERQASTASAAIDAETGLDEERGFVTTAVRGALRWRPKLDYLIVKLAKRKIASLDPDVATLLRLALYELLEMETPSWAAVNEHVGIAARRFPHAKGFVNAVLRNATRKPLADLLPQEADVEANAVRTGHPSWLLRRWIGRFGEERAMRIAEADQEPSYPDLVVNTRRLSMEDASALLRERGVNATRSPLGVPVFRLRQSTAAVRPEIDAGLFHPMDEGSVVVAWTVGPGSVLDLAAAPGGKSIVLDLRGRDVVSHDVSLGRLLTLRRLRGRFAGGPGKIVWGDGAAAPFRKRFASVLVDAPCSASGTLRKNPEVKLRLSEERIVACVPAQRALLEAAAELAGREIVYATCSLEVEENAELVVDFLRRHPEFERFDLSERLPEEVRGAVVEGELVLTPDWGTDGFTVTGLRRRESRRSSAPVEEAERNVER